MVFTCTISLFEVESCVFVVVGGQTAEENDIIKLTRQLINSIADKDYKEYA